MKMLSRVLLVASSLTACSSGTPNPSAPVIGTIPQIAGTYTGPTSDSSVTPPLQLALFTIKFARGPDSGSSWRFRSCTGTLTLQQTGSNFSGSFTQGGDCPSVSGLVTNGTIRTDGAVTFSLLAPASDPLAWTGFGQCTSLAAGALEFTGKVNGTLLDASFARDAIVECPREGAMSLNVRVRGAR